MKLTRYTDYAMRVLIHLGSRDDGDGGGLSSIAEIARVYDISQNHLMKVVHQLGQRGYLETIRGRNGGIRLAMAPHRINLGTIVRATEDDLNVLGCLQGPGYCRIERECILRRALAEATKAFLAVLDDYTLVDLLKPGKALSRLLEIDWRPPAPICWQTARKSPSASSGTISRASRSRTSTT